MTDEFGEANRHTVYGDTPQEARENAATIRKRVDGGQPARDRRQTVAAFAQHWIDTTLQASERKQTTRVMYAGVARTHIPSSSIGRLTLDRVRPSHVEGWVVELRRKGLAESTIRSACTILRAVLATAVRDGALASNPAAVVRRPRVTAKEAPHLTPAQVAELLRAAEDTRYAPLFACAQVRPRNDGGPAPSGTRPASCSPPRRGALRPTQRPASPPGRCTGAGLPHAGLHTLRHSAASVMPTHGVPLTVVSEILGHSSIALTGDVYGHVAPDVSQGAMDVLGAAFGE